MIQRGLGVMLQVNEVKHLGAPKSALLGAEILR
jgi:hypothetical protein